MSPEALLTSRARRPTSMRLPEALMLHIFSLLSHHAQAWSARLVCKSAHAMFGSVNKINASSKELPLWVVQQMYRRKHQRQAEDSKSSRSASQLPSSCVRQCVIHPAGGLQLLYREQDRLPHQQLQAHDSTVEELSTQQQPLQLLRLPEDVQLLASRAAAGDIQAVEWLAGQGCFTSSCKICSAAAGAGQLHMLQYLRQQQLPYPWDASTCTAAAAVGSIEVLQWAMLEAQSCCECNVWTTRAAARSGQLATLEWLQEHRLLQWDVWAAKAAAAAGQLAILQWAQKQEPALAIDEWASRSAAAAGHTHVLQWLHAHSVPWDVWTTRAAAAGGHIPALDWLLSQQPPCPVDGMACMVEAKAGNLEVLQWLRARQPPCPYDESACSAAAYRGQLRALQWLRSQQPPCPFNQFACLGAAQEGWLKVLQWLRAEGCPWNKQACLDAAGSRDHGDAVHWVQQQPDDEA